jgi:lipopolysaccharide export system protein LptA
VAAKAGAAKANLDAVELRRAMQRGGVTLLRTTVAKPGTAAVSQRGSAAEADYDAVTDAATLAGSAQLADATSAVQAQRIVLLHESGDATADGAVRVTYVQASATTQATQPERVHVLADRGVLHHDDGIAIFDGKPARLWQTGTQVEAAVLELDQNKHTLFAHSNVAGDLAAVHAVLAPAAKPGQPPVKQKTQSSAKPGAAQPQGPVRVTSRELTYNDTTRQIDLRGSVLVQDADGSMHASQATVFLQPAAKPSADSGAPVAKAAPAVAMPGGQIDHIVATGGIEIQQPGRTAMGERLVYTASDGVFVLTGTASVPPKAIDVEQGTVTGDSLRFKTGDDSILVTSGGGTRRVHSVTQMKQ